MQMFTDSYMIIVNPYFARNKAAYYRFIPHLAAIKVRLLWWRRIYWTRDKSASNNDVCGDKIAVIYELLRCWVTPMKNVVSMNT